MGAIYWGYLKYFHASMRPADVRSQRRQSQAATSQIFKAIKQEYFITAKIMP
jgi:hypothetical protein